MMRKNSAPSGPAINGAQRVSAAIFYPRDLIFMAYLSVALRASPHKGRGPSYRGPGLPMRS